MNVLIFLGTLGTGGISTVTNIIASGLIKRNHRVYILLSKKINIEQYASSASANSINLPDTELFSKSNIEFLNQLIKEKQISIIINQWGLFEPLQFIDSISNKNIPRISVLHSNPLLNLDSLFRDSMILRDSTFIEKLKRIARFLLFPKIKNQFFNDRVSHLKNIEKGGSFIVTLSPSYSKIIENIIPRYASKITSIPNPTVYDSVKITKKEKIVLFTGRLNEREKRVISLIRIWRKICKKHSDWKLVILGDGPDRQKLEKEALNIPNIEFRGFINPQEFYEKSSIFCLTSAFEGFPMSLIEAMQHGCVPISYDSFPAVYDIITHNHDGIVVPNNQTKIFIKSLDNLIENEDLRTKLSTNARSSVQKFNKENIIDKWEGLLLKINHLNEN